MRLQRLSRQGRPSRSRIIGASGGGGAPAIPLEGGIALVQIFNPGVWTAADFVGSPGDGSEGVDVSNGNWVFGCGARAASGTPSTNGGIKSLNETNSLVTYMAEQFFDSIGTTKGAGQADYLVISTAGSYVANDSDAVYNSGHAAVGLEMSGVTAISTVLASTVVEGVNSDPTVASIPGGDGYDALLVVFAARLTTWETAEAEVTEKFTPSLTMEAFSAHTAFSSRRSTAFIGVMGPTTDEFTLGVTDKSFVGSGYIMEIYGLTGT